MKPFPDTKVKSMYWKLVVNNIEVSGRRRACINSLSFDELCDGSDTLTLSITDPDFLFIEDNIYIEDAKVLCEVGFNEDTYRYKFEGFISAIDIDFPTDGSPTLNITCLDNTHIMNRTKKERSWDNVTRADVVRKIAQEYGFKTDIEPNYTFAVEETITQSSSTDIKFLESLAEQERELFMCKLVNNTIVYRKKGLLSTPRMTLNYKSVDYTVMAFSPQITKETRREEVTVSNIDTGDKTYETYTATSENVSRDVQGEPMNTSSTVTETKAPATSTSASNGDKTPKGYSYDAEKRQWVRK